MITAQDARKMQRPIDDLDIALRLLEFSIMNCMLSSSKEYQIEMEISYEIQSNFITLVEGYGYQVEEDENSNVLKISW